MANNHDEVSELKKQLAVFKVNNERVREENDAYKKQNASLVQEVKNLKEPEDEFSIT